MIRSSVLAFLCLTVLGTPLVAVAECYGPVGRNDTLWLIAVRLRPDPSISPQRMMLALLEANPEAFGRNNINALYAGSTLCVGPVDSIETDEHAAIAEVRRHNREWKSGRAPVGTGSQVPPPAPSGAAVGGEEPARPRRAVVAETLEPARSQEQDREPHGSLRLDRAVAAVEARLSQVEDRIERLESGYRGAGATQIEEELVRLATQVARIEDRIRVLTAFLETKDEAAEREAMEPMPTPAPRSHEAMEPMPTPAPPSHEAMEPMPTPAPRSHEAMEPMPTPAPQTREAAGPEPEPAPEERDFEERLSARVAAWLERVRELLKQ